MRRFILFAILVLLVLGAAGITAGSALAKSGVFLPGDMLFPIQHFSEQAQALSKGGVDGFIIETMFDLKEALCALRACKDCSSKPVFVSMSFATAENGGRTMMGNSAEECALLLTESGADAVGVNCGDLDPFQSAFIVSVFKKNTHLLIIDGYKNTKIQTQNIREG